MFWLTAAVIYTAFFGVIGYACYAADSAWPLLAILLTPSMKRTKERTDD